MVTEGTSVPQIPVVLVPPPVPFPFPPTGGFPVSVLPSLIEIVVEGRLTTVPVVLSVIVRSTFQFPTQRLEEGRVPPFPVTVFPVTLSTAFHVYP